VAQRNVGRKLASWRRPALAALVSTLLFAGCAASPGSGGLPVVYSMTAGLAHSAADVPPGGANQWGCQPSVAHPRPVVLVHGTFMNQQNNWFTLSPLLKNSGYCVFTFDYGGPPALGFVYGLGEVRRSADELSAFVDQVLGATGASQVDLVGHSQGGMMPHVYLQDGGATKVHTFVALAPSNDGTTLFGLATIAALFGIDDLAGLVCASCEQQVHGSEFLTELRSAGLVQPGVHYTVIATQFDEIVTPWSSAFLPAGPNVTNLLLQDVCPVDFSGHIGLAYSPNALRLVLNALDPAHASASCRLVPTVN